MEPGHVDRLAPPPLSGPGFYRHHQPTIHHRQILASKHETQSQTCRPWPRLPVRSNFHRQVSQVRYLHDQIPRRANGGGNVVLGCAGWEEGKLQAELTNAWSALFQG